ncbi:glycosyltransferase family 2 protein [Candidatus Pacearchaeota archaeon]|nr:glycosyltransferase family 2 protein [Candidatus Pacearchaeota archaeon]
MKKVAIVISTYNQEDLLKKCLNSLQKTDYKNYKIFLVDDSGNKKIGKNIKRYFKKIDITITKGSSGFSKVYNIGARRALKNYAPDYVLLLNDDTEVTDRSWLKKMIEVGESDEKIGVLGCKLIYPDGSLQNIGGYVREWEITKNMDESKKQVFEVDHVMGAFILIKRKVIDKIGLLDEIYNPYLLEDTDYCLRAKEKGFKIVSVPCVKIIHKKGKTVDTSPNSERMFVRFKNDIIFSRRHLKGWNKFFRIFIFLPMVAVFRKNTDEDELKFKNFKLRKSFLINIILWIKALFYNLLNGKN